MPRLSEFPGGTLFLDANIILEHMLRAEPSATACLHRIRTGEIHGALSVLVLTEIRHRLLLTEVVRRGYVTEARRALDVVQRRPALIAHLTDADRELSALLELPVRVVSVTPAQFRAGQRLSLRHHLLTNDAIHLATMRAHGWRHLASADRDFLRIPRLTVWHL